MIYQYIVSNSLRNKVSEGLLKDLIDKRINNSPFLASYNQKDIVQGFIWKLDVFQTNKSWEENLEFSYFLVIFDIFLRGL